LWLIDPATKRVLRRVALPASPAGFDVTQTMAAIAGAGNNGIIRVALRDGAIRGLTERGFACGAIRFRNDGKTILAGAASAKELVTLDANSGTLLARLPLPFVPARFCFNADGGQMFVTGGEDEIAIVSPYQSEVDQTIVAGRSPFAMAVSASRDLLLVTNPPSGDLTILDIETRRLAASVHIGGDPGELALTPDGEYALVVGRNSGDVSVVRLSTVLDHKIKTKPLFTGFAMAANPRSGIIVPTEPERS
jgi:DNA-binding beta-propeller fold protein YncE